MTRQLSYATLFIISSIFSAGSLANIIAPAGCTQIDMKTKLSADILANYQVKRLRNIYYDCTFGSTQGTYRIIQFTQGGTLVPSSSSDGSSIFHNNWGSRYNLPLDGSIFSSQTPGSNLIVNVGGDTLRQELDSSLKGNESWKNIAIVGAHATLQNMDILQGHVAPRQNWKLLSETLWVEDGEAEIELRAHFSESVTLKNGKLTGSNDVFTPVFHSYGTSELLNQEIKFTADPNGTGLYVHDGYLNIRDDQHATTSNFELGISNNAIFEITATSTNVFTIDQGTVNNAGTIKMHGSGPRLHTKAPVTFNHSGQLDIAFNSILDVDGTFNFNGGSLKSAGGEISIETMNVEADSSIEHAHIGGGTGLKIEQLNVNNGHLLISRPQGNNSDPIVITQAEINNNAALTLQHDVRSDQIHVLSGGELNVLTGTELTYQINANSNEVLTIDQGGALNFTGADRFTLGVDGDLSIDGTLSMRVDSDTDTSDQIRVGLTQQHNMTLGSNSSLKIEASGSNFAALAQQNKRYRIIEGTGTLTGTFNSYQDNLHYFDFMPVYTGRDVELEVQQVSLPAVPAPSNTANHQNFQSALLKTVSTSNTQHANNTTPASCANYADPNLHCITGNASFDKTLNQYLSASTASVDKFHHTASGEAYANYLSVLAEQNEHFSHSAMRYLGEPVIESDNEGFAASTKADTWVDAFHLDGRIGSYKDISGFDYAVSGLLIGSDIANNRFGSIGGFFAYGDSKMHDTIHDHASASSSHYALAAYTRLQFGRYQTAAVLGLSHSETDMKRNVDVSTIQHSAKANYNSDALFFDIAAQYPINFIYLTLTPEIGLSYQLIKTDDIKESGADAMNLNIAGGNTYTLQNYLGLKTSHGFSVGQQRLTPYLGTRYYYDWSANKGNANDITVSFAQVQNTVASHQQIGHNRGKNAVEVDAGIEWQWASQQRAYATLLYSDNTHGHEKGAKIGYLVDF